MIGPEHYRLAERCLAEVRRANQVIVPNAELLLKEAHVHAMLAVAAAIVESGSTPPSQRWSDLVWPHTS